MAMYMALDRDILLRAEREILPLALREDYEQVQRLLLILSCAVRQDVPLTPLLANFLADALRTISEGGNTNDAFRIKRKRGGRDTKAAAEKAIDRVSRIKALRRGIPKLSLEKAVAQVVAETHASEDTVRAAWRDYRDCVELDESGSGYFYDLSKKK